MSGVRTRFAPSPTGHLHIGGARTALFNYLFARRQGGRFILRIEDTDRERSTPESIDAILDGLRWLRLNWDEGPVFQSERSPLYREHIERLLRQEKAYRCYCTSEELEAKRKAALAANRSPVYDRTCRERADRPPNRSFTVRFKAPLTGETVVRDLIKGNVVVQNRELDDLIIARSDGSPTFNLCAVVDDALMEITHIIRGEDHLSNTPKQLQLYRAFGYPTPEFAHAPLILGADRTRLSKRHGATSITAYRESGYLPDALINYLVRLGWSHGDQELFTRAELIEKFSLSQVGTAAGVFDPDKLEWVNFQHLKSMQPAALAEAVRPHIAARGWSVPEEPRLSKMVTTLRERAKTLVELVESGSYYWTDALRIDPKAAAKHLAKADPGVFRLVLDALQAVRPWDAPAIEAEFRRVMETHKIKLGKLAQPVRVALTGGAVSPGIFELIEAMGRELVLARLGAALPLVGKAVADQPPTT